MSPALGSPGGSTGSGRGSWANDGILSIAGLVIGGAFALAVTFGIGQLVGAFGS